MADACVLLRPLVPDGFNGLSHGFGKFRQGFPFIVELVKIFVFVLVTGLAGVGNFRVLQRNLGQQGYKYMAVDMAGFGTLGNPWHMAPHAVGKGMNRMSHVLVDLHVAFETLAGACCVSL